MFGSIISSTSSACSTSNASEAPNAMNDYYDDDYVPEYDESDYSYTYTYTYTYTYAYDNKKLF
jgi:hypothetical protein